MEPTVRIELTCNCLQGSCLTTRLCWQIGAEGETRTLKSQFLRLERIPIPSLPHCLVGKDGFEPPRLSSRIYSPVHSTTLPLTHKWYAIPDSNRCYYRERVVS